MAENELKPPAANPAPDVKPDEVSLEEIDRLLEADDPDFAQSLNQIKEVGVEGDVNIESLVDGEESLSVDDDDGEKRSDQHPLLAKLLKPIKYIKSHTYTRWLRFKTQLVILLRQAFILARTLPVEFVGYIKAMLKALLGLMRRWIQAIRALSWAQRLAWIGFLSLSVVAILLLKMNLKGVWLTGFDPSVMSDVTTEADRVWTKQPDEKMVPLYRAFPQEEIEYLFPKIVVNLKRSNAYNNPMGAFEFYAVLDSNDTALEVKARTKELHDRLQRALEEQTYSELSSPLGKKRVKDILRRELNDVLSQGWVKDILIKTMIVKP